MFDQLFDVLEGRRRWAIIRGDAVEVLKRCPGGSIDSFVSDPPYGIELALNTTGKRLSILGDGKREARQLWRRWVPEAYRAAKPDTSHAIFGTWKSPWMSASLAHHFNVKGCIAWDKKVIGLGHFLRPRWEMIYFCTKGRPARIGVAPADVWIHPRIHRPKHPCEKPVDLLRRLIKLAAPPGSIIFDPFAGIGSTGVAALLEGYRFIGVERDPRFAPVARARCRGAFSTTD